MVEFWRDLRKRFEKARELASREGGLNEARE